MSTRMRARMITIGLLATLALGFGDNAFAYWRASGIGSGAEVSGTTVSVTLSPGTPTATLYPGGQADVLLTVSNPNASPVHIGSLALDTGQGTSGFAVDAGHAACAVAILSYTTQTNGGAGWTVPGKVGAVNGTLAITLTNALSMGVAAANACQGATSTVFLAAG